MKGVKVKKAVEIEKAGNDSLTITKKVKGT